MNSPESKSQRPVARKQLWLLRHAKSSWDDPGLRDQDRPLAPRGERAADLIGSFVDAEGIRPQLVLCSSALRTRQTLERVLPALGSEIETRIDPALYAFDHTALIERLAHLPEDLTAVMVVGHNPAIHDLAVHLAGQGERLEELARKFPTGALAEIELGSRTWADLGEGSGTLARFVVPRDLA